MLLVLTHIGFYCRYERGDRAFHVCGATPVQVAVALRGHKGLGMPLIERTGGYDVGVPRETDQRCAATATRPQVIDVAETQVLDRETKFAQTLRQNLLAARVVRRNGNARDQLARETQRRGYRHRWGRFSSFRHPH